MDINLNIEGENVTVQERRQREREVRRIRGEISCYECRRMKIKCDRKVPCSSCIKRRCQDRCPNGTIRSAATDLRVLQAELLKAKERISELEEALRVAQAKVTDSVHPLLASYTSTNTSSDAAFSTKHTSGDPEQDLLETFGTLTVADSGESRFIGPSAASESLILSDIRHSNQSALPEIPSEIYYISRSWPFAALHTARGQVQNVIESLLPSFERASALCEAYLQNLSWFSFSITRTHLIEEILPTVYRRNDRTKDKMVDTRDLALLLAVFSCGAAGDLTQKANNAEGRLYYYLARASMALGTDLCRGCVQAVMSLCLLGMYNLFACPTDDTEETWRSLAFAMVACTASGLHRDPGRWNLGPQEQQRRRRVFWGVCLLDYYRALSCGRPPTISLDSVDVEFPQDDPILARDDTSPNTAYSFWIEFLRKCLGPVVQRLCANPRPVKFREVMALDKEIREFEAEQATWLQQDMVRPIDATDSVSAVKQIAQRQVCNTLLMGIHRNFFARAILDHPDDPLRSPFAPSFLTALRLATSMIQKLQELLQLNMSLLLRIWPIWSHSLNAAVIVGSVASRCPKSNLAPTAYAALESAIISFRKATEHPIAVRGLPILLRLQEKALRALSNTQTLLDVQPTRADEEHELNILRGTSRLVSQKIVRKPSAEPTVSMQNGHQSPPEFTTKEQTVSSEVLGTASLHPSPDSIQLDLDNWVADIDAIMVNYQRQDYLELPTAGLAAGDSSFTSLAPDAFVQLTSDSNGCHTECVDGVLNTWDPYSVNILLDDTGLW